ncbi:MAG: hypothetical protein ACXW3G_10950 [Rhodoplanes sp.]
MNATLKMSMGFVLGLGIGVALYFAVVTALPALGKHTWIVL